MWLKKTKFQLPSEEIFNAISHGVLAILSVIISIFLLIWANGIPKKIVGALIYGISLTCLYVFSCIYHAITSHNCKTKVLKRFDHISIYLLIGGTYTPLLLNLAFLNDNIFFLNLTVGEFYCLIQWILITIGIVFKSIWLKQFHWIHLIIFLALGWTAVFFIDKIYLYSTLFFWLIVIGGLSYTIGVIFYVNSKVYLFHFIWHIFVIIGTILHLTAIILFVYR
jgi:hemolysin III